MSLHLYRTRVQGERGSPQEPQTPPQEPQTPSPRTPEQRLINNNWTVVPQEPSTPEVFHENRTRTHLYGSYGTVKRRLFSTQKERMKSHLKEFQEIIFDEEKVKNKVSEDVYLKMMNLLKKIHEEL